MADEDRIRNDRGDKRDEDKKHATMGGTPQNVVPGPVEYNIANLNSPQVQTAATTAPANTSAQNAANAAADQRKLQTFFSTGSGYAPQYEVDYSRVAQITAANPANNAIVSGGAANNPT